MRSDGYTESMKRFGKEYNDLCKWFKKYSPEPDFSFNSIYVNKNVEVKKHIDIDNRDDTYFYYIVEDGSGGELIVYDEDDDTKVKHIVKECEFYKMNGYKQYHEGTPFTGLNRYSIVFYTNKFFETTEAIKDYVVCIPSYNRAELLNMKTLNTLQKHNINPLKIFIYVSSVEEKKQYLKILDKKLYNKIKIGAKGIVQNREKITNGYPNDFNILYLDDDIDDVDISLTEHTSLNDFIIYAFHTARVNGCYLWGIYPVYNSFYREKQKQYTTDLRFIIGGFYGIINRFKCEDLKIQLSQINSQKEDVERTIKYFIKDGKVLRFNRVGYKTKYCGNDGGGLGKLKDRILQMKDACILLENTYGKYGKTKVRKNGMYEFVLNKNI
jgi:hypothetical protein